MGKFKKKIRDPERICVLEPQRLGTGKGRVPVAWKGRVHLLIRDLVAHRPRKVGAILDKLPEARVKVGIGEDAAGLELTVNEPLEWRLEAETAGPNGSSQVSAVTSLLHQS